MWCLLGLATIGLAAPQGFEELHEAAGKANNSWLIGTASTSILPTVNNRTDYWVQQDEYDTHSPGTFVLEFDLGRIPVGWGSTDAHWVRDDVRTTAMALRGTNVDETLLLVSCDVWVLLGNDIEVFKERLAAVIDPVLFSQLRFLTSATHNHFGPDTSGLSVLNRDWFSYMLDKMVLVAVEALASMRPVTLRIATSEWRFGQGDARDPRVADPNMNVIQARDLSSGAVVATIVQYTYHAQITGTGSFQPVGTPEECAALGEPAGCSATGRYLTADYPGHLRNYIRNEVGGETLLYVGAIGVNIGANSNSITPAPVWEVSEDYPISGDGSVAPDGAELLPRTFRYTRLIGRELAYQALRTLSSSGVDIPPSAIQYSTIEGYTRLTNLLFRIGLAPNPTDETIPVLLGYSLRPLYNCEFGLPPTDETCVSDNYQTIPVFGPITAPVRKGDFARVTLALVRIGPAVMVTVPGDLASEVANGLPSDFDIVPDSKYYLRPDLHAVGANYTLPGVLKDMMECEFCWMLGHTNDYGGYIFPISDWRISCQIEGDPVCNPAGYIEGLVCKNVIDSGIEEGREACLLGQLSGVEGHGEETFSGGWDLAADLLTYLGRLLGNAPRGRYTKPDWTQP
eukprot:TRINITY_DN895_c0_g1_i1.p1 TRINITY_DN895_c0_g1~~TRINITY_DN895_c0_g1_i1.p1  ORF type:complete len:626 (-),score=116.65 TRINITY_DN895_c0_g1_i1:24-1901(-)